MYLINLGQISESLKIECNHTTEGWTNIDILNCWT